jgi:hypothetical protein
MAFEPTPISPDTDFARLVVGMMLMVPFPGRTIKQWPADPYQAVGLIREQEKRDSLGGR